MSCEAVDRIGRVALSSGVPRRHLVQAVALAVLARQSPDRAATVRRGSASLSLALHADDTVTGVARRIADAVGCAPGPIAISAAGSGSGLPSGGTVHVIEGPGDSLALTTDLCERQISRVITAVESFGQAGGEGPRMRELCLRSPADIRDLQGWGRRLASVPAISLDELVARWARQRPNRPAAVAGARTLTYAEADRQATLLASALIRNDVQHGEPVIVRTGDRLGTVIAHVAVLRAGAVCVPLPVDRDPCEAVQLTRARLALCDTPSAAHRVPPGLRALSMDDLLEDGRTGAGGIDRSLPRSGFTDCAYAMVRLGEHGRIHGDLIDHHAWVSATTARISRAGTPAERVLVDGPLCTPTALAGMWWALQSGGTVCLADTVAHGTADRLAQGGFTEALLDPEAYVRALRLLDGARPPQCVVLTGGPCPPELVARHFGRLPATRLFVEYAPDGGPLPWAAAEVKPGDGEWPDARTGLLPTTNTQLHVVDEEGHPLGPGLVGEVCADGMALPCDRIAGPAGPAPLPRFQEGDGPAVHRSGRLARWRFDGTLEILEGRTE
ncbi:AMP-binding protein [Streptantibioticus ferralitis]|uniref:AMP-binding protein n=1 Tax=Streptantibioticus ferralitis TaxID=236510 RepID=A0ABT5YVU6_9ACTN|nr:AMP-binding protein [Streptantibioticus ferralitis]MDF2255732.1 AMP-binding protein [Streptantibioticus ferralitis]